MIKINKCDLCNNKNLKYIYSDRDKMYNIKGNYPLNICNNCGLIFLNPQPNREEISKHYPKKKYYSLKEAPSSKKRKLTDKLIYPANGSILLKLLLNPIRPFLRTTKIIKNGKILDVGCGTGNFLRKMKKYNMKCYGIEPNDFDKKNAKKHKLNIFHGTLTQAKYPDNYFDVITINHVLEHVNNPTRTLEELRRILKPNGTLIITVPQSNSLAHKIFKKYWIHLDIPRHIYQYSTITLKKYAKKTGFKIETITYKQRPFGFSGSILYWSNKFRKKQTYLSDHNIISRTLISLLFIPLSYICNILKTGDEVEIILTK